MVEASALRLWYKSFSANVPGNERMLQTFVSKSLKGYLQYINSNRIALQLHSTREASLQKHPICTTETSIVICLVLMAHS